MNTKTTLPISEARKKIFEMAEKVQRPSTHYILTEKGRPKVAFMSAEEFESWQETLETMRDFPNLEKDIKKADRDVKSGEYKDYPTLEEVLGEYGFVLADKSKTKHGVSSKIRAKSKKTTGKNS